MNLTIPNSTAKLIGLPHIAKFLLRRLSTSSSDKDIW